MKKFLSLFICLTVLLSLAACSLGGGNGDNGNADDVKNKVLPGAGSFTDLTSQITDKYPDGIVSMFSSDKGYIFEVSVKGKDTMVIMCGISLDGKVVGIDIVSENETPGYKNQVFSLVLGADGCYNNMNIHTLEPELVSGATLTSRGVYNAVQAALTAYDLLINSADDSGSSDGSDDCFDDIFDTSSNIDEATLALLTALVGDADFADITPQDSERYNKEYLKALYRASGGRGYVAHVVVNSTDYDRVESEALIHIGTDGEIKNIERLTFKTSDEGWGFVPPADTAVDAFYDGLNGASSGTIEDVDLITGATVTSAGVRDSLAEALSAVDAAIRKTYMPKTDEEVKALAARLVGSEVTLTDVTPPNTKNIEYTKRIYKTGSNGYVAYVVVNSTYYDRVESEALIHVGADGEIKNIEKLTFKTGDEGWGFVPPVSDKVDEFYAGLNGASSGTIEDVDLITGATNTSGNVVRSVKEVLGVINAIRKAEAN